MLYMVTTINIPPMLAYIPYMDPMGYELWKTELPRSHWASYAELWSSLDRNNANHSADPGTKAQSAAWPKAFQGLCHPQPTEFGPFFVPKHSFFFLGYPQKDRYPIWICRVNFVGPHCPHSQSCLDPFMSIPSASQVAKPLPVGSGSL